VPLLSRALAVATEGDALPLFAMRAVAVAVRMDLSIQAQAVGAARDLVRLATCPCLDAHCVARRNQGLTHGRGATRARRSSVPCWPS
jgi:hypothetical protein